MDKEPATDSATATPSTGPTSKDLPIRPRPKEAVVESTVENESHDNKRDEAQHKQVDPEDKDKIDLFLKNGEEEPKNKKKRKPRSKKTKNKPTGFEEYYADPPLTVAEFEENKTLYDLSRPASQRLETAVQRYQANRRMDSDRRSVFTKYMAFGGVTVGPKMFGGVDQKDMEDMDAEEIITARAQTSITDDRSAWIIDFEAVAKGFLSSVLPLYFALDTEKLATSSVNIVKNFLNYILHHDVCPEYKDNINAARVVCDMASKELWNTRQAVSWGTGNFNSACAQLFGGFGEGLDEEDLVSSKVNEQLKGMTDNAARKVVKLALAGAGTYEQAVRFRDLANKNELVATQLEQKGFEVTAVIPVDNGLRDFYHHQAPDLEPVGKIRAKLWHDPSLAKEDLPPQADKEIVSYKPPVEYEFFLEETLLKFYFVGMKVDATIWELNCGAYYFDHILSTSCSFYTVLENDKMFGWKKPRDLRLDGLDVGEADYEDDEDGEEVEL